MVNALPLSCHGYGGRAMVGRGQGKKNLAAQQQQHPPRSSWGRTVGRTRVGGTPKPQQQRRGVQAAAAPEPASPDPRISTTEASNDAISSNNNTKSSSSSSSGPSAPLLLRAAAQVAVLAVALAALILLPAQLSGRLSADPVSTTADYALYLLFFASGSISRMLRYGQLAPRKEDRQVATSGSRLAFALFLVAVPAGHYLAWWDSSLAAAVGSGGAAAKALLSALPAVGYALMLSGWALNALAAAALGKAYNRLVTPECLVTSGPYALVQHPIYSSYMLLFCGFCLCLGSPIAAMLLLAACLVYYRSRTLIEEQLLEAAFGEHYRQYRSRTGRFVPRWLQVAL